MGATAFDELARMRLFDLRFARDLLRGVPLWYESASEGLKQTLNNLGFGYAKLVWEVVVGKDEMQKMKMANLEYVEHLGHGAHGICCLLRDKVSIIGYLLLVGQSIELWYLPWE